MDIWAVCGNNGTINRTTFTADCKSNSERVAAYGTQLISKGIAEWTIRYNITGNQCCREIGISDNTDILNGYINSKAYVWYNSGIHCKGSNKASVENIDKNNDIITIKLDLNKNKLSFYKNNDTNKIVILDVEPNKTWKLAAHIDTAGQSFTIETFKWTERIFDVDKLIAKDAEIKILMDRNERLQQTFDENQAKNKALNDELIREIDELKNKSLKSKIYELNTRISKANNVVVLFMLLVSAAMVSAAFLIN